jgi:hypothetical protein
MVTLDPFFPKKNSFEWVAAKLSNSFFCVMKIHHKRKLYSLPSYYMRFSNLNQCYLVLDFERNQVWFWFWFLFIGLREVVQSFQQFLFKFFFHWMLEMDFEWIH